VYKKCQPEEYLKCLYVFYLDHLYLPKRPVKLWPLDITFMYTYINICIYICMYIQKCIYIYVYTHVYMYVCICIYICVHIHIYTQVCIFIYYIYFLHIYFYTYSFTYIPPLPLLLISEDIRDLLRVDEALLTSFKDTDILGAIGGMSDEEGEDEGSFAKEGSLEEVGSLDEEEEGTDSFKLLF
jgi:hypothetical protein